MFVIGFPLILMLVFRRFGSHKLMIYSLVLMVMMFGQLPFDMLEGMYGVPLFFPFSNELYMIPYAWQLIEIES